MALCLNYLKRSHAMFDKYIAFLLSETLTMSIKVNTNNLFFSLFFVLLFSLLSCSPKALIVTIEKPKTSNYAYAQVEPSIAINPRNPKEIIAGTVLNEYYYSANGGLSWTALSLTSPYGVNGDPVVLIDNQGNYFYFHLSNPDEDTRLDRIVCQRTSSLSYPMSTVGHTEVNGKMHDKHWAAIDPNSGTIHMAWTQFDKYKSKTPGDSSVIVYAQSKDYGSTWSQPIRISRLAGNCLDDSGSIEGVTICMGLMGEVYIAYCLNEKIYLNVSVDGGQTWMSSEREIADQPGGWSFDISGIYRMNGFPSLQMDVSNSDFRGRLYLSWSDQRNGKSNTDVWLIYSDDQGQTWSEIKAVNNDHGSRQQFMSTMRVDPKTGHIVALFYDRRDHMDWRTDVFLAYSEDGGSTFKNFKLNKRAFAPNPKIFFGDYLAVDIYNDVVHAMWPELYLGKISLKYARIDLNERMKSDARSKM
jgi:hypothetical protein